MVEWASAPIWLELRCAGWEMCYVEYNVLVCVGKEVPPEG